MDARDSNYWKRRPLSGRFSRRGLLRGGAVLGGGLVASSLVGCGDDDDDTAVPTGTTAPGSSATVAATATPDTAPTRGGVLKVGLDVEPRGLDPHTTVGGESWPHQELLFDNLVQFSPYTKMLDADYSLAESWEQVDDLTLVFTLRDGVKMNKTEEPVDADLIVWNLERASSGAASKLAFQGVSSIEAGAGSNEVVIKFADPVAPFLETLIRRRGACIISREHLEAVGDDALCGTVSAPAPLRSQAGSRTHRSNTKQFRTTGVPMRVATPFPTSKASSSV